MDIFGRKENFSGKKRTNSGGFLQKGPLSDQGLIKQTYLAALQEEDKTGGDGGGEFMFDLGGEEGGDNREEGGFAGLFN